MGLREIRGFRNPSNISPVAIPDSGVDQTGLLYNYHAPESGGSDGDPVSTLIDVEAGENLTGSGTFREQVFGEFQAIELDGGSDVFSGSVSSLGQSEYTVAGLVKMLTVSANEPIYHAGADGDGMALVPEDTAFVHSLQFADGRWTQSTGTNYIFVQTYDGSTGVLDVNDSEVINRSGDFNGPTTQIHVGEFLETNARGNFYLGQIAFWNTHKTDTERSTIHDQIASNWGLI